MVAPPVYHVPNQVSVTGISEEVDELFHSPEQWLAQTAHRYETKGL